MQTLHIEHALISGASVPSYKVVNWDQVTAMEFEHTLRHEPNPVEIKLHLADRSTVQPRARIKGFPIPVIAKELETFIHVRNQLDGYADFSRFQAYLDEKHGEK